MERLFEDEQAAPPQRDGRSNSYQLFERCARVLSRAPNELEGREELMCPSSTYNRATPT
jgi:hypothetical protein